MSLNSVESNCSTDQINGDQQTCDKNGGLRENIRDTRKTCYPTASSKCTFDFASLETFKLHAHVHGH